MGPKPSLRETFFDHFFQPSYFKLDKKVGRKVFAILVF